MIKKLSKEELAATQKQQIGRRSVVRKWIDSLKPGDSISIEKSDWKAKTRGPEYICRNIERESSRRYKVYRLLDGSGWAIERTR